MSGSGSKVTAIVINYNGEHVIEPCLRSLQEQSRPPGEILVIDNASTDTSRSILERHFPDVRLHFLAANVGYPAACNLGIRESTGDLVAILNNDLVLDRRWLECLLSYDCAPWDFWASRILFAESPGRVDSAGDGMAVVGTAYKIGHGDSAEQHSLVREVFGPCGAAALYRRRMLDSLEGFDADFFLIYEDADLNLRARLRGHRCLFVPEARAYHHVNLSIRTFSETYVFFGHRNSETVFWKNMPLSLLLLYLPERLLFDLLSFLFFCTRGRGMSFLKAKADFVRRFPGLLRKRRKVQSSRTIGTRHLRSLLDRNWFRYRRKVRSAS